jgi:hypothetical protein
MPVTYRIVPELRLVLSTWEGAVTLEDGRRHNESLRADPEFDPSMRQLSDARRARSAVSADGVRGLARHSAFGPSSRRAILVADDDAYAVSRMYAAQANKAGRVRIFRDLRDALAWLEVEASDLGLED